MPASGNVRPIHEWTASEIARAVNGGSITCEDVARACLARIEAREPQVLAWQYLNPDRVLEQARALDRSPRRGPLQGVPFGIKDIIDTDDMPTEYGTPIHKGRQPQIDAACVALTRRAGGLIMGKTVTTEFANFFPGKTRNPFDPRRTPGGSSSGSGAAVGAEMVPLAIGTQTTASTIRPAAFCGCVGYRPTWGDLRCAGVMEASGSLDTLGLIARSIDDIALYRDVLMGITPEALPDDAGSPPRIGFCRSPMWDQCEPETKQLLENCASTLARAGAAVSDIELPAEFARIEDAHRWISSFEFARNRAWEIDHHRDRISETLRNNRIRNGLDCSEQTYLEARALAERCRLRLDDLFAGYDVLLTPAVAGEAPLGLNATGNASFCAIWTTMHVPAMTLPLFTGPSGLPVGAQLVARRDDDRRLMMAARWVQRACA